MYIIKNKSKTSEMSWFCGDESVRDVALILFTGWKPIKTTFSHMLVRTIWRSALTCMTHRIDYPRRGMVNLLLVSSRNLMYGKTKIWKHRRRKMNLKIIKKFGILTITIYYSCMLVQHCQTDGKQNCIYFLICTYCTIPHNWIIV